MAQIMSATDTAYLNWKKYNKEPPHTLCSMYAMFDFYGVADGSF